MQKATVIKMIQDKARDLGRTPKKNECDWGPEAVKLFGSWRNALAAAGFTRKTQISEKDIIDEFERKRKELGRLPTMQEFQPHCQLLYKKYGSWENAMKAMGYLYPLSKEALEKEVLDYVDSHNGKSPKITDLEHGVAIARKLGNGSYNQALRSLNLRPQTAHGSTKEDLIYLLQEKAKELGHTPVATDLDQFSTIIRRFGSWNNALRAAGLPTWKKSHNSHISLTNQELLCDIQILLLKNDGRRPKFREYSHGGLCLKRFNKWSTAVDMAIEDPYETKNIARKLWEKQQEESKKK